MSDNDLIQKGQDDLIRRGDALVACQGMDPEGDINAIPAVQPTVKPLVWQFEQEDVQVADTSARHQYRIVFDRRATVGAWMWFCDGKWICLETEQSAKAAAQADYDARILSALDMQPTVSPKQLAAQPDDVAALVEALENVIGEYDLFRKEEYERGLAPLDDEIHEARAALARVKGVM